MTPEAPLLIISQAENSDNADQFWTMLDFVKQCTIILLQTWQNNEERSGWGKGFTISQNGLTFILYGKTHPRSLWMIQS